MIPGNTPQEFFGAAAAAAAGGVTAGRSVRFNSADGSTLTRTPASAGNRRTFTLSFWFKPALATAGEHYLFYAWNGGSAELDYWDLRYNTSRALYIGNYNGAWRATTAVFRDPAAWYHIVVAWDTTQSTASNRIRLYVNGSEVTAFSTSSDPALNAQGQVNAASSHVIGSGISGYLALIHLIDGQALTPSSFGETSATTGQWIAKTYSGTYGTNGFFLDFSNASSTTTIGQDASGNNNNWTANNITVLGAPSPSTATISTVTTESLAVSTYQVRRGAGSRTGTPPQSWSSATAMGDQTINVGSNFNPSAPGVVNWGSGDWLYFKLNTSSVALIGLLTTGNGPMRLYGSSDGSSWTSVYTGDNGTRLAQSSTAYEYYAWCMQDQVVAANDYGVKGPRTLITVGSNQNLTSFSLGQYVTQSNSGATGYIATLDTGSYVFGLLSTTGTWAANGTNTVLGPSTLNTTAACDTLRDHPTSAGTSTGLGGEVSGNYCTLNPLAITNLPATPSNGNLETTGNRNSYGTIALPSSGKWYWEVTPTAGTDPMIGMAAYDSTTNSAILQTSVFYYINGNKYITGTGTAYGASYALNDVIGVAANIDAGTVTFYKNNTSQGAITFNAAGLFPASTTGGGSATYTFNFGQRAFAYTAPSGFQPLVDTLLPTPTIAKPNTVMDVKLYTGNGGTPQTISGLNFEADLLWFANRTSAGYLNPIIDQVRGLNKYLTPYATNAESTNANMVTATSSTGFTVGSSAQVNDTSQAMVAWLWDAGSSNATNTSGTITSTVRANISAGFSVVSYLGNNTSGATFGHGLGVAPQMVIVKLRADVAGWMVWHRAASASNNHFLILNQTDAVSTNSAYFQGVNSTTVTVGASDNTNSSVSPGCIAYCWTPVAGYSAFGSYTGNGSSDGPFVYTGFRPRWVMVKCTTAATTQDWVIMDAARRTYNAIGPLLYPNASVAEDTADVIDFTSNGFKIRATFGNYNTNTNNYIYAAFAEAPFPYARAR